MFEKLAKQGAFSLPELESAEELFSIDFDDLEDAEEKEKPAPIAHDCINELRYVNQSLRGQYAQLDEALSMHLMKRQSGFGDQCQRAIDVPNFFESCQLTGHLGKDKRASLELANSKQVFINSWISDTLNALQAD